MVLIWQATRVNFDFQFYKSVIAAIYLKKKFHFTFNKLGCFQKGKRNEKIFSTQPTSPGLLSLRNASEAAGATIIIIIIGFSSYELLILSAKNW